MKLILASGSKKRREIFDYIGIPYEVMKSGIDEHSNYKKPNLYVMDLSKQKGLSVSEKAEENSLIVSCDTIICMNGKVYEKPKTKEEARKNIQEMVGKKTYAYTGVTIIDNKTHKICTYCDKASLKFRDDITQEEIDWYIDHDEYLLERCGYNVQGKGIIFIEKSTGDFNTVLGISAGSLMSHIYQMGYHIQDFL